MVHTGKAKKSKKVDKSTEDKQFFDRILKSQGYQPNPYRSLGSLTDQQRGFDAGIVQGKHEGISTYIEGGAPKYRIDMRDPLNGEKRTSFAASKSQASKDVEEMVYGSIRPSTAMSRLSKLRAGRESIFLQSPQVVDTTFEQGISRIKREPRPPPAAVQDYLLRNTVDLRNRNIMATDIGTSLSNNPVIFNRDEYIPRSSIKAKSRKSVLYGV